MDPLRLVQPEPGQSRYAALAAALRARIVAGEWPPGTAIPAEQLLAGEHGVALGTMRRALELLTEQGFIERIHGRGTFVKPALSGASMARFFRFGGGSGQVPASRILAREALPAPVRVPAGHDLRLWSVAKGAIKYVCRKQAQAGGGYAWAADAPAARLYDVYLREIGRYYGGPTWESVDGSKVTARQLAVVPAEAGSMPLQLLQARPASGRGTMQGVSYIQRLNTRGGVAPDQPCDARSAGSERMVTYEADYVFYGPR